MADLAARFFALFAALDRVHGTYEIPVGKTVQPGQKLEGRAQTIHAPVTLNEWREHLKGGLGLGLVPIRDNGTIRFGAIDVDDYTVDLKKLAKLVASLNLPLIPCRSKSGGCQLYLFGAEDLPATLVRGKLMEWAVAIGHSGVEIFPKQTKLAGPNDHGSWINVPYQAWETGRSLRYALDSKGEAIDAEGFLSLAQQIALTEADLVAFKLPSASVNDELLEDSPPCLQTLAIKGFPQGSRNNGLFNVAVYVKKRWPDDWEHRLDAYNQKFMDPPLTSQEVGAIIKGARKKDYAYRCSDHPISSVCNRTICLTRKYGVGGFSDDPGVTFGQLVKLTTEPETYLWDVNGLRLELSAEELMNQVACRLAVMRKLNVITSLVRAPAWTKILRERMERLEIIEVPKDVTPTGQLVTHLEDFCGSKSKAQSLDELLLKRPYENGETVAFRAKDFLAYLGDRRISGVKEREIFMLLRELEGVADFQVLKGKGVNFWRVRLEKLNRQREGFDAPRVNGGGF